jgi:ATP-dependent RNA helicase DeaD
VHRAPEAGMQSFRIEVGYVHGVKPGNIVGAIANEAGLEARHIGRIEIYDNYSTLDLPDDLPADLLGHLGKVWVAGQQLRISREGEPAHSGERAREKTRTPASEPAGGSARKGQAEAHAEMEASAARKRERSAPGMEAYRIEVGHAHGVKPANIVGAIANEAGLDPKHIGRIDIHDDYSVLDLPEGMPKQVFQQLKTVSVLGQQLRISRASRPAQDESHFSSGAGTGSDGKSGDRAQRNAKPGSGKRMTDTAKTKPKAHRKGFKP